MRRQLRLRQVRRLATWLLLSTSAVLCVPAWGFTISGQVVGVSDGDTVVVLDAARQQHRIRLAGIDAPEKGQSFGTKSKQALSGLVFKRAVTATCAKLDRYGRSVCKLLVGDRDVNAAQLASGMAWVYRAYLAELTAEDRSAYATAEDEARSRRSGLWSDPAPVPPWVWRRSEQQLD